MQLVHYSENVATTNSSNYPFLCNMPAEFLILWYLGLITKVTTQKELTTMMRIYDKDQILTVSRTGRKGHFRENGLCDF